MGEFSINQGKTPQLSNDSIKQFLSRKPDKETPTFFQAKTDVSIESDDAFKLPGLSIEPDNMVYDTSSAGTTYAASIDKAEEGASEVKDDTKTDDKDKTKTEEQEETKSNSQKWGDYLGSDGEKTMVCRDASGKTQNIEGKLDIVKKSENGEPEQFTITDSSSGSDHAYLYQKVGVDENGKAIYKCVSMNGDPITTENEYTLEWTDGNQPELVQHEGQANHGIGLKVGKKSSSAETAAGEEKPDEVDKKPAITPEERAKARDLGDKVSDHLVGYTTDKEIEDIKRIIEEEVTEENVADFLKGYEDNKSLGDSFFRQMITEWGFDEKKDLMRNVAEKLSAHMRANGHGDLADKIDEILKNPDLSKDNADELDKITAEYLKTLPDTEE